jgi:hypothetical protein
VLERSAEQTSFFESGKTKLVMPAVGHGAAPIVREQHQGATNGQEGKGSGTGTGGAGEGTGGQNDPLIKALIQKLSGAGPWPTAERITWLKMLTMAFQMSYGQEAEIKIKEAAN